ncbi:MAG: DNA polymerase IV [Gemmiger sp.]|nr:DNA polymerase IV [Gemmiger sp.]
MPRVYFHVDVNSAFLSWSAIKLLRAGGTVDLRTIPAAVGGNEETRHGVVLAKSMPAKAYGIRTGESLFAARAKCPALTVTPPDFDWYVQNSKAMIQIFGDYTPDIEQYSIDEAFLDMTGTEGLFGPPRRAAAQLKERIYKELGFTVNIGIAPNRLLAKMASDFEKPNRIHTLFPEEIPAKMWPLPAGALFGVGPSAAKRLAKAGIYTIGEIAQAPRKVLTDIFGVRGGTVWDYANGIESEPMTKTSARDTTYGNSATTAQDLATPAEADTLLLSLAESVASRLRLDGKSARVVTVQVCDNAFRRTSHQTSLPSPTNSTEVIYHTAKALLRQLWPGRPVRLVGVTAEHTGEDHFEQLTLFADPHHADKQEKLDRAADALRKKFGEDAIVRAKLLKPGEKPATHGGLGAAKARQKRGENG